MQITGRQTVPFSPQYQAPFITICLKKKKQNENNKDHEQEVIYMQIKSHFICLSGE